MKIFSFTALFIVLSLSVIKAQDVPVIKYEELFSKIEKPSDELFVVNFWATWCGPCVEEMPLFVEAYEKYKDNSNFKMVLVSLDRSKQLDKVKQFIKDYNIKADVVLLDDNKRMNEWIPKVNSSWSGNIPVTAFYQNGEVVHFVGAEVTKEELNQLINIYLK